MKFHNWITKIIVYLSIQVFYLSSATFSLGLVAIVRDMGFPKVSTKSDVTRSVICLNLPFDSPQIKRSIRLLGHTTSTDAYMVSKIEHFVKKTSEDYC